MCVIDIAEFAKLSCHRATINPCSQTAFFACATVDSESFTVVRSELVSSEHAVVCFARVGLHLETAGCVDAFFNTVKLKKRRVKIYIIAVAGKRDWLVERG